MEMLWKMGRGGGSGEGNGASGAGSEEGGGGGGGDEDVLAVHNWRQQGGKQYLCLMREGGCMEWRSARTALRLSLHWDYLQRDRLSTLCVHGRDSEQVCTQHWRMLTVWNVITALERVRISR